MLGKTFSHVIVGGVSGHRGSWRSDSRSATFTMDPFFVAATLGVPEHGPGSLNLGGLRLPLQCERRQRKNLRERSDCVDDQLKIE